MSKSERATLWDLLETNTAVREQEPALLFFQKEEVLYFSYGQLRKQAVMLAKGLIALGIQTGEHVGIWTSNRPEWLTLVYAGAAVGTPLVMINTGYRRVELEFALGQMDVAALFVADSQGAANDYFDTLAKLCPELLEKPPGKWHSAKFPKLRYVIGLGVRKLPGMLAWTDLFPAAATIADSLFLRRLKQVNPDDTAMILFTSGTTGEPKGALLSHQNLLSNVRSAQKSLQFTEADRLCLPIPLFHAYGILMVIIAAQVGAACVICGAERVNQIVPVIRDCGVTVLCGTPTMLNGWLEVLENWKSDVSSLTRAISAGASLYTETVNRILTKTTIKEIWNMLGLTETLFVTANRVTRTPEAELIPVGMALEGVEVKSVRDAGGQESQPGETGELFVRSCGVMKGYYNKSEATAKAIDVEGWYHSGDMAVVDSQGLVTIAGRSKEMLIRGGENIFPAEVEECLMSHSKVKEAQVVAIPSEYYGEEPVAFVILRKGESATQLELKRYCRERIAYFKVPVYVYFVTSFPKTASGKIQKFKLKEEALERVKK